MTIKYVSFDDKEFDTKAECLAYQLFGKRQIDLNDEERKAYQRERKRNSRKRIAAEAAKGRN